MGITITEAAAERIRGYMERRGKGVGLRLAVRNTGCSGYAYAIDYADEVGPDDVVFEANGAKLVVDRESLKLLDGTEVDYVREGLNEGFRFNNPNVKATCGCGESFTV
ncbi:MAG TPA: iron-sulfur cluster assembly protein IscA [Chromatiales bacterium]|nr:iron-sulfur cluster assembly protein IscA [Chromatiales bacterium]